MQGRGGVRGVLGGPDPLPALSRHPHFPALRTAQGDEMLGEGRDGCRGGRTFGAPFDAARRLRPGKLNHWERDNDTSSAVWQSSGWIATLNRGHGAWREWHCHRSPGALQINRLGARLWCCRVDHPSDHWSQKHLPLELQVYPHEDLAPLPWLEMHVQCFLVPTARAFESSKDMPAIRPHLHLHQPMYETASADAE